ncbi:hypothetical protein FO519_005089 [Halicephalobus sp. NKZ332]|nr:hypothetical protein FO519_005089 [Halicephalobus sp. NKZ332]
MNALDILKQEMNKKRKAVEDLAKGNKFIRLGDIPNKAKQKYEEQQKELKEAENDTKKNPDLKADDILKDAEVIPRQEAVKKLRERNLPMEEDPIQSIEEVLGTTDPTMICQCFDDLLEKDPTDSTTWQSYLSYLKEKNLSQIVSAYSKYCRAFPEDVFAWQDYIFHLEKYGKEWKALEEVFREAIEFAEDQYAIMTLFRSITYAKLRYEKATAVLDDIEPDYFSVAKLFQEGDSYLVQNFGHGDLNFKKNYANFAFLFLKDVELGRKLWREILASGIGNKAKWWIEAAEQERRFGSADTARKLLYRGVNSVFEKPMELFDYFIQFEREEGTFDQMSKALKRPKGKKRVMEIHQDEQQSPMKKSREQEVVIKDKDGFVVPPIPVRSPRRDRSQSPSNGITQLPPSLKLDKSPSPKPTESPENRNLNNVEEFYSEKTIFVSNLDFSVGASEVKKLFPDCIEVRLIPRPGTNLSKGYGYVDFATLESAREALKMDRATIKGRPVFVSENKPHEKGEHAEFKYATGVEVNKLFVKNLPFKCGNKELKEAFQAFGEVKDARIVTKKSGHSKCCGYVDFESEADARKVLSSQIEIGGRSITCYISNPPKKQDPKQQMRKSEFESGRKSEPEGGRKSRINAFVPRSVATKTK